MAAGSFSFPLLENEDLLPCMEEMETPITAAQLAKPTADVVGPVFEGALLNLTGMTREELNQPLFAAIDAFEYPELHDESVAVRNLFRHLSKLLATCGVRDFGLKDLHKPDPVRLRRQLSALVNFAKFREEKLAAYQEMAGRLEALAQQQAQLQARVAACERERRATLDARGAEEQEAEAVLAEVAELTAQNQALNKTFIALTGDVKGLKAQCNALADAAQQEKLELTAARQEQERLQEQVVTSPERFRRALQELSAALEQERAGVEEATRAQGEVAARHETVCRVDKEVAKCVELMAELEAAVATKKQHSRAAKELREAISGAQLDAGDLEQQQQHVRRQLATLGDRIRRLESQGAVKREAMESAVEEQARERDAVEAENAAQAALVSQHEAETRAVAERTAELKQRHAATVAALLQRYRALRAEVAAYSRGVEAVMVQTKLHRLQVAADGGGDAAAAAAAEGDVAVGRDQ